MELVKVEQTKTPAIFINLVDEWLQYRITKKKRLSESTVSTYLGVIRQLQKFLNYNSELDDKTIQVFNELARQERPVITPEMINLYNQEKSPLNINKLGMWKESLLNNLQVETVNLYIVVAKSFFRFLNGGDKEENIFQYYPNDCYEIKTVTVESDEDTYKKEYVRDKWLYQMLKNIDVSVMSKKYQDLERARNIALIMIKRFMGLRDIGISRLTHKDFKEYGNGYWLDVQDKGKKKKKLKLCIPDVVTAIKAYKHELSNIIDFTGNDPMFVSLSNNSYGRALSRASMRKVHRALIDSLDITLDEKKVVSGHSFRHAFATYGYEAGISLDEIQQQLGHSSTKMTRRYTRMKPEQVWGGVEKAFEGTANKVSQIIGYSNEEWKTETSVG